MVVSILHKSYLMQRILINIKSHPFIKYGHLHPDYAANLVACSEVLPFSLDPIAREAQPRVQLNNSKRLSFIIHAEFSRVSYVLLLWRSVLFGPLQILILYHSGRMGQIMEGIGNIQLINYLKP